MSGRPCAALRVANGPVGIPRQREQDTHVSERQRDDAPAFDHVPTRNALQGTQAVAASAAICQAIMSPGRA